MKRLILICAVLFSIAATAQEVEFNSIGFTSLEHSDFDIKTDKFIPEDNVDNKSLITVTNDSTLLIQVKRKGYYTSYFGYDIYNTEESEKGDFTVLHAANEFDHIMLFIYDFHVELFYKWNPHKELFMDRCVYYNKER